MPEPFTCPAETRDLRRAYLPNSLSPISPIAKGQIIASRVARQRTLQTPDIHGEGAQKTSVFPLGAILPFPESLHGLTILRATFGTGGSIRYSGRRQYRSVVDGR